MAENAHFINKGKKGYEKIHPRHCKGNLFWHWVELLWVKKMRVVNIGGFGHQLTGMLLRSTQYGGGVWRITYIWRAWPVADEAIAMAIGIKESEWYIYMQVVDRSDLPWKRWLNMVCHCKPIGVAWHICGCKEISAAYSHMNFLQTLAAAVYR